MDPKRIEAPLSKKSFWKEKYSDLWCFYCPLCKLERRIPYRPQPGGFRHFAQIGLLSIVFTMATYPWLSWKGIVAFLPFWTVFEVIYRSRVRAALMCPHCGFDACLFLVDRGKARQEVETYWRKKLEEKGIPYPEAKPAPRSQPPTLSP